ncbi:MAG: hypothetical protein HYY37_03150 [Candidatus Aenigmarchaeota archaeon]|nr:hypothetical protein [Candidatus Aenigmarchaeota archaeon]
MTLHLSDEEMQEFLSRYSRDPGVTNIAAEEVLRHASQEGDVMGIPIVYAFGNKGSGDRYLDLMRICRGGAFIRIPVADGAYGVREVVELQPTGVLDAPLNEPSRRAYEQLLGRGSVPFPELLDTAGYIINTSMRFTSQNSSARKALEIAGAAYAPRGDETLEGVCTDSGRLTRRLLYSLNPQGVRYGELSSFIGDIPHDATAVFIPGSEGVQAWGVINSKSPRLPYNFVPAEELDLYVPRARK